MIWKDRLKSQGAQWIQATGPQWEFLRGISAMSPVTPPGLPFGDKAIIASKEGDETGMVMFIDGGQVCGMMAAPKMLMEMLKDVKTGTILHQGAPM